MLINAAGDAILASMEFDTPLHFANAQDVFLIGFPLILSQTSEAAENVIP